MAGSVPLTTILMTTANQKGGRFSVAVVRRGHAEPRGFSGSSAGLSGFAVLPALGLDGVSGSAHGSLFDSVSATESRSDHGIARAAKALGRAYPSCARSQGKKTSKSQSK